MYVPTFVNFDCYLCRYNDHKSWLIISTPRFDFMKEFQLKFTDKIEMVKYKNYKYCFSWTIHSKNLVSNYQIHICLLLWDENLSEIQG
jgi:hypothetical protein